MSEVVHIITMPSRRDSIMKEMERHEINAVYWPAVHGPKPIENINKAHKTIIRWAKENNKERILIGEDDLRFFGEPGEGFKYFLDNRPKEPYDIYLSSFYSGTRMEGLRVKGIAGLTLYECSSSFYDGFLSLPDTRHIDKAIGTSDARIFVSPKFCTYQEPGFSFQRKRYADDSVKLKDQPIFGQ